MKISYAVTVCNEFVEIQRLIPFLLMHKRPQDEIVVQMDLNPDDLKDMPQDKREVFAYIMRYNTDQDFRLRVIFNPLRGDFAAFKNHLSSQCMGDYIFQIDADELPHKDLIANLPSILEHNSSVDLYVVPRVNTVEGLTQEHIQKWGWNTNEKGWVNWPDFQTRIYRNMYTIKWVNKVHERLDGHKQFAYLPMEEEWALYHPKTIERQEKQNNFYNNI